MSAPASLWPSPSGYAGFVQPRSGLAFKHGIMVVNSPGLIDAGYRGEVRVSLYNSGREPFVVAVGERIAQLVVQRVEEPEFVAADELPETQQGRGGLRQQRAVMEQDVGQLVVGDSPRRTPQRGYLGTVYSSQVFGTMATLGCACSFSRRM